MFMYIGYTVNTSHYHLRLAIKSSLWNSPAFHHLCVASWVRTVCEVT